MKKLLIAGVVIVVLLIGFYALNDYIYTQKQQYTATDYKNAEYIIAGERVRLENGVAENKETKTTTRYFGDEIEKDLNGDERKDVVFLVTQEADGSGTFYYVVAAINTEDGYVGSEGVLLGDRIAPQTTESGNGKIVIVNYADRALGEPFTTQPSVGKSIWLLLDADSMQFGEVAQNFEGEADPTRMSLDMKTWNWVSAKKDGEEFETNKKEAFSITFKNDGTFGATTDCNSMGGEYSAEGSSINFSDVVTTLMFCEGSQEGEFAALLASAESYEFTSKGELVFSLESGSDTMTFR